MYESILIPLDGSKVSEASLPVIEELISKLSPTLTIRIILLQVIDVVTRTSAPIYYDAEEIAQIKKRALDYLNQVGQRLQKKQTRIDVEVREGLIAEEIIKAADDFNTDFITMSTHGHSGISRWALGSVTDKVIRGSTKPVFIIRSQNNQ
jgi:nucleotide-binding universal stress UspA family protein